MIRSSLHVFLEHEFQNLKWRGRHVPQVLLGIDHKQSKRHNTLACRANMNVMSVEADLIKATSWEERYSPARNTFEC